MKFNPLFLKIVKYLCFKLVSLWIIIQFKEIF